MSKKLALAFFLSLTVFLQSLFLVSLQKNIFAQSCGGNGAVCTGIGSQSSCCTGYTCKSNNVPGNATGSCQQSTTINCGGEGKPCCATTGCGGSLICSSGNICVNPTALDPSAPAFPELRYPCDKQKDVEFHSLRPYQASPCGEANKAAYCSNNLIFVESFDMSGKNDCTSKKQTGDFICHPNHSVDPHNLYVSLDDSDFPILGNTENVKNSQSSTDTYDDARKVNEYVSWYLSGVNTRAEYGNPTDDQTVNFSGPVQKLLPQAIAEAQRISIIKTVDQKINHNQTVVCANKTLQIPSWVPVIGGFGIGKSTAVPCYDGAIKHKLTDWKGENTIQKWFNVIGQDITKLFPGNSVAQVMANMGIRWADKAPPLPWGFDPTGKQFTQTTYQKAYNEWRGDICAIFPNPFSGKDSLLCLGVPGITNNEYADLFPYIPLAVTNDKEGSENITGVDLSPSGGEIDIKNPGLRVIPPLYFAHTEEVKQLSETLNKTYIPKDVKSVPLPETTEKNECSVVNVRANPGDNLFPGDPSELQLQGVAYKITQATCHEVYEEICETDPDPPHRQSCHWEDTLFECPVDVTITIKTETLTPSANEIFSTTVADSASTFRKIYPKVEEGSPVSCIADIPTVTDVTYDPLIGKNPGSQKPNGGSLTFKVKNIPEDGGNTTPQLTFPHIGSVYEYFLKGIQTALRPKGYGDPTPISGTSCVNTTSVACGELPENLPGASGSCGLGSISSRVGNIPDSFKKIVEAAATTYNTPPNLILGVMYGEGFFNPGKYDLSEDNVKSWATCEKMPNCSGAINFGGYWPSIANAITKDLKKLDPNRKSPDQCNLLDLIYGISYSLHKSASGSSAFKNEDGSPYSCLGQKLNTAGEGSVPSSCDWNPSQYESAIRIWEFGTGWGATSLGFYTCATKDNSCATGGGAAAQCPTDTAINPDTCKTSGNNSHNLCVWEVGHGN